MEAKILTEHAEMQEASAVPSHSTPSWERLSQEGNSSILQASSQADTSQVVHSLGSSQAGRQVSNPLPRDSATSQEASTSQAGRQASIPLPRDSAASQEASTSQAGRQASSSLLGDSAASQEASTSQAGRQASSSPPGDSAASQEASTFQAGRQANSPPPRDNATSQEASTPSNHIPSGEGFSQAENNPSIGTVPFQAGRQATRHLTRNRSPQLPKGIVLLLRSVVLVPRKEPLPPIGPPRVFLRRTLP